MSDAHTIASRLQDLQDLQQNRMWLTWFHPKLTEALETHLKGISDPSSSSEKRSQHVEAYHLAFELESCVEDEIQRLKDKLRTANREPVIMDIPAPR